MHTIENCFLIVSKSFSFNYCWTIRFSDLIIQNLDIFKQAPAFTPALKRSPQSLILLCFLIYYKNEKQIKNKITKLPTHRLSCNFLTFTDQFARFTKLFSQYFEALKSWSLYMHNKQINTLHHVTSKIYEQNTAYILVYIHLLLLKEYGCILLDVP